MKQAAFIFLSSGLIGIGCSSEDEAEASANPKPLPGGGVAAGDGGTGGLGTEENGAQPGGGLVPQPSNEGIEKLNPTNDIPVLAERNGRYYQVYEIAEKTYTGRVVLYHPDGITESSEKIFMDGLLTRHTEWHANKQKKMESVLQPDGTMKIAHFDEHGKPVKAPVRIIIAPGRGLEWTKGFGASRTNIDGYKGQSAELIKRVFGDPDEDQNGVWIYKGMKVKVAQPGSPAGQLMTTVRFVIQDNKVLDVAVEP
jgi:hypothetical protein